MKSKLLAVATAAVISALPCTIQAQAPAAQDGVFTADFSNPNIAPSHWVLTLRRDGSGHFHAEGAKDGVPLKKTGIEVPSEDRDVQLSKEFTAQVFTLAQQHNWFNENCESRAKVAFQGWKKISYSGPEGQGSCTFNYSQDKQIQELGESIIGVAETLHEGAKLELLLVHDRLGLDREMEYITDGTKEGRLREIVVIRDILQRLAQDDELLERVRKRARNLLAKSGS
jgi:hypothetical protein